MKKFIFNLNGCDTFRPDKEDLTIKITSPNVESGETTKHTSIDLKFVTSSETEDFSEEDITVTNGTISDFVGFDKEYTATFRPDAGGLSKIDVSAEKFMDPNSAWPCCGLNKKKNVKADTFEWTYSDIETDYHKVTMRARLPASDGNYERFDDNDLVNGSTVTGAALEAVEKYGFRVYFTVKTSEKAANSSWSYFFTPTAEEIRLENAKLVEGYKNPFESGVAAQESYVAELLLDAPEDQNEYAIIVSLDSFRYEVPQAVGAEAGKLGFRLFCKK